MIGVVSYALRQSSLPASASSRRLSHSLALPTAIPKKARSHDVQVSVRSLERRGTSPPICVSYLAQITPIVGKHGFCEGL
jgi:hypothetical protein